MYNCIFRKFTPCVNSFCPKFRGALVAHGTHPAPQIIAVNRFNPSAVTAAQPFDMLKATTFVIFLYYSQLSVSLAGLVYEFIAFISPCCQSRRTPSPYLPVRLRVPDQACTLSGLLTVQFFHEAVFPSVRLNYLQSEALRFRDNRCL